MERIYHFTSKVRNQLFCSSSTTTDTPLRRRTRTTRVVRRIDPIIRNALVHTMQEDMRIIKTTELEDPIVEEEDPNTTNSNNIETTLHEIDNELRMVQEQLATAIQKEQFISQRTHTYQKLLDEQAYRIKQQQQQPQIVHTSDKNDHDEENDIETGVPNDDVDIATPVSIDDDDTVKNPLVMDDKATSTSTAAITNQTNMQTNVDIQNNNINDNNERRLQQWEKNMDALASIRNTHLEILSTIETLRRQLLMLEKQKTSLQQQYNECTTFIDVATLTAEQEEGCAVLTTPNENNMTTTTTTTTTTSTE